MASVMVTWVLPTPVGPRKTTFSLRSTKPSSYSESIWSCLTVGWKLKSKSASVLTAGSRLERIAVCWRRLCRSAIWAATSRSSELHSPPSLRRQVHGFRG